MSPALFAELEGQCETFKANADGASIARIMKEHALSVRIPPELAISSRHII